MVHPLHIGLWLRGQDTTVEDLRTVWRVADEAGLDHVWVFYHRASIGRAVPTFPWTRDGRFRRRWPTS